MTNVGNPTITSASYNSVHQTLQLQVSVSDGPSEVFVYSNNVDSSLVDSGASVLASGAVSATGTGSVTLTVPVTGPLSSFLSTLYVSEATGSLFAATPNVSVAPAQVATSNFPALTGTITQTGSSAGTQSTSDTITITASGGAGVTGVTISVDGGVAQNAQQQADGSWTFSATGLSEKAHTFKAVVSDNAGNTATSQRSPTWSTYPRQPSTPSVNR